MSCGERLLEEMRRRGVRVTPQRSVILETISHLGGHSTAVEIFHQASRRLPGLNPATVYRALEALRRAGMVVTMAGADGGARFAVRDPERPHHHLVCTTCGAELELEHDAIARLGMRLRQRHGFRLQEDHLTLNGLCSECYTKRAGS